MAYLTYNIYIYTVYINEIYQTGCSNFGIDWNPYSYIILEIPTGLQNQWLNPIIGLLTYPISLGKFYKVVLHDWLRWFTSVASIA